MKIAKIFEALENRNEIKSKLATMGIKFAFKRNYSFNKIKLSLLSNIHIVLA